MSNTTIPTPAEDPALWANSNGQILGASMALLVLPTVFVALRLVSRYMAGAGFWVSYGDVALRRSRYAIEKKLISISISGMISP